MKLRFPVMLCKIALANIFNNYRKIYLRVIRINFLRYVTIILFFNLSMYIVFINFSNMLYSCICFVTSDCEISFVLPHLLLINFFCIFYSCCVGYFFFFFRIYLFKEILRKSNFKLHILLE